ncbi:MAG: hypothetical protein R6V60_16940, partial [Desulfobacterales bacterium]
MFFPDYRPRRLRQNEAFRRMIRETRLSIDDLVLPLFAVSGRNVQNPIPSMPDQYQLSIDCLVKTARQAAELGIPGVLLFGVPDKKDELATGAYARNGIVKRTIKAVKEAVPDLAVISDVCLCQYTSHGHCGVVEGRSVLNDATLDLLMRTGRRDAFVQGQHLGGTGLLQRRSRNQAHRHRDRRRPVGLLDGAGRAD